MTKRALYLILCLAGFGCAQFERNHGIHAGRADVVQQMIGNAQRAAPKRHVTPESVRFSAQQNEKYLDTSFRKEINAYLAALLGAKRTITALGTEDPKSAIPNALMAHWLFDPILNSREIPLRWNFLAHDGEKVTVRFEYSGGHVEMREYRFRKEGEDVYLIDVVPIRDDPQRIPLTDRSSYTRLREINAKVRQQ